MTPDDPRHGTYAGSVAHYREHTDLCVPCRTAHRRYNRRSQKRTRMGYQSGYPVNTIQPHIAKLRKSGMSIVSIAQAAGVAITTVENIIHGRRQRVTGRVAAAIYAVEPTQLDTTPAWRVERRLQALYALGWTSSDIARHTGWSPQNVRALMHTRWRHRKTVKGDTFRAFDTIYRRLSMTIPPETPGSLVAKSRAYASGWAPPLAFDNIDDQLARPRGARVSSRIDIYDGKHIVDEATVLRLLRGEKVPANTAERDETLRRWRAMGRSQRSLCATHGWKEDRYDRASA